MPPISSPRRDRTRASSALGLALAFGSATLVAAGCGDGGPTGADQDVQQITGDVRGAGAAPNASSTLSFETFDDDPGARGATESRVLIRSARGYQAFFGHDAPAAVDFSREWVMFYAAGTKSSGGYEASFLVLLRADKSLIAITRLVSPGAACATDQVITTPHAFIKFPAQIGTSAEFFKQDAIGDCVPNPCAAVQCASGQACDPATGQCVGGGVRCGGIAGLSCPGMGACADDRSDGCDPQAGGADCGGLCTCVQNFKCASGTHFVSDPSVCACVANTPVDCPPVCDIYCEYGNVPDANGCPTCSCNPSPDEDPCATVRCAAGTHCDAATGRCTENPASCGGFAGKACPGSGVCADDPSDDCDPSNGGADCIGICTCVQNVACTANSTFDSSPLVCACVTAT